MFWDENKNFSLESRTRIVLINLRLWERESIRRQSGENFWEYFNKRMRISSIQSRVSQGEGWPGKKPILTSVYQKWELSLGAAKDLIMFLFARLVGFAFSKVVLFQVWVCQGLWLCGHCSAKEAVPPSSCMRSRDSRLFVTAPAFFCLL